MFRGGSGRDEWQVIRVFQTAETTCENAQWQKWEMHSGKWEKRQCRCDWEVEKWSGKEGGHLADPLLMQCISPTPGDRNSMHLATAQGSPPSVPGKRKGRPRAISEYVPYWGWDWAVVYRLTQFPCSLWEYKRCLSWVLYSMALSFLSIRPLQLCSHKQNPNTSTPCISTLFVFPPLLLPGRIFLNQVLPQC